MQKLYKSQSDVAHLTVIGLLLVFAVVGFTGWRVWQVNQDNKKSANSSDSQHSDKTDARDDAVATNRFKDEDLKISFDYPKEWGQATIKKGTLDEGPGSSDYKQVTFSNEPKIDFNFIVGSFRSPLDGCGLEPLKMAKFSLSSTRASVIGWDATGIKKLYTIQGATEESIITEGLKPGDNTPGYEARTVIGKVMAYKDYDKKPYKAMSGEDIICFEVTQAEADQANEYSKYMHYALNFKNAKVKGVNAQYDARSADNQSRDNEIVQALISVKTL